MFAFTQPVEWQRAVDLLTERAEQVKAEIGNLSTAIVPAAPNDGTLLMNMPSSSSNSKPGADLAAIMADDQPKKKARTYDSYMTSANKPVRKSAFGGK